MIRQYGPHGDCLTWSNPLCWCHARPLRVDRWFNFSEKVCEPFLFAEYVSYCWRWWVFWYWWIYHWTSWERFTLSLPCIPTWLGVYRKHTLQPYVACVRCVEFVMLLGFCGILNLRKRENLWWLGLLDKKAHLILYVGYSKWFHKALNSDCATIT